MASSNKPMYSIEAWTIPTDGDEEPSIQEVVRMADFPMTPRGQQQATEWMWERLEEGLFIRLWVR
jgi:hypothetical protein